MIRLLSSIIAIGLVGNLWANMPEDGEGVIFEEGPFTYEILSESIVCLKMAQEGMKGFVTIPATVDYKENTYQVERIGEKAFFNSEVDTVVIGEGIKDIDVGAFGMCLNLQSATLPSTLEHIGDAAFWTCSSLQSVNFPQGLSEIGIQAFYSCTRLESVIIPSTIGMVRHEAFMGCGSLESITFEGSPELDYSVFCSCNKLKKVISKESTPFTLKESATVFELVDLSTVSLYVPDESVGLYQQAPVWNEMSVHGMSEYLAGVESPSSSEKNQGVKGGNGFAKSLFIYDLSGRRVANSSEFQGSSFRLPKGVYIQNGKKVVVK